MGGGETESVCHRTRQHTGSVLTCLPNKNNHDSNQKWGGRCLVSLPLLPLPRQSLACNATGQAAPQQQEQNQQKKPTRQRPDQPRPTTTIPADLGVGVLSSEYGSKKAIVARMKRHKGNPKPQKWFGFPQHLRKREREKERKRRRRKYRTDRERTGNNLANRFQVLKGTKTNIIPTTEARRTTQNTQHPSQKT